MTKLYGLLGQKPQRIVGLDGASDISAQPLKSGPLAPYKAQSFAVTLAGDAGAIVTADRAPGHLREAGPGRQRPQGVRDQGRREDLAAELRRPGQPVVPGQRRQRRPAAAGPPRRRAGQPGRDRFRRRHASRPEDGAGRCPGAAGDAQRGHQAELRRDRDGPDHERRQAVEAGRVPAAAAGPDQHHRRGLGQAGHHRDRDRQRGAAALAGQHRRVQPAVAARFGAGASCPSTSRRTRTRTRCR